MRCLNLNEITQRCLMIYSSSYFPHAHTSVASSKLEKFGNIKNTVTTQTNFYFFLFFSGSTRKTWTATRRSFFKRRKGGRSSSRKSSVVKELSLEKDLPSFLSLKTDLLVFVQVLGVDPEKNGVLESGWDNPMFSDHIHLVLFAPCSQNCFFIRMGKIWRHLKLFYNSN